MGLFLCSCNNAKGRKKATFKHAILPGDNYSNCEEEKPTCTPLQLVPIIA